MLRKLFLASIIIITFVPYSYSGILFSETFETYTLGQQNFFGAYCGDTSYPGRSSITGSQNYYKIVSTPTRSGSKALEFFNHYIDSSSDANEGYRTEIYPCDGSNTLLLNIGSEYWIAWSIYLPADFACDLCNPDGYDGEIHTQMHGLPDPGEDSRNPPLALRLSNDKWNFSILCDADAITVNKAYDRQIEYDLGSWSGDVGKWTDWVLHVKLDYTAAGTNGGFTKLYKNGVLVVDDTGGNCFNDQQGLLPSFGTYKFSWRDQPTNIDTRIVYYDEIKIGDSSSSYNEVSPSSGSTTPHLYISGSGHVYMYNGHPIK